MNYMVEQDDMTEVWLTQLGLALSESRKLAIDHRKGIETEWQEDEEFYEGIDNVNREDRNTKPQGTTRPEDEVGSTVFLNITRPYCDAASARVSDMLLPTKDRNWALGPTPVPDMIQIAGGKIPQRINKQIDEAFPQDPETATKVKTDLVTEMQEVMAEAKAKCERAQLRIEDWHVQCQFNSEVSRIIEDTTQIGTGVLKGPVPIEVTQMAFVGGALVLKKSIAPASFRVDPWNCYPDPACGENIQNGCYHWEKDDISRREVENLLGQENYISSQILKVLKEGPYEGSCRENDSRELNWLSKRETKDLFQIWYYYGRLSYDELKGAENLQKPCGCEEDCECLNSMDIHVTMINNRVIKAVPNINKKGEIPYDYMVWQKRKGSPWGIGVARQIRTPQRIVNGGGRNMMDNAGAAGGPMLLVQNGVVTPEDGIFVIKPWKIWLADESADSSHLDNAFRYVVAPMLQQDLENIIRLGLRMAEDVTGLPLIMQGQMSERTPNTLGQSQLQNTNASTVLRRIATLFDERITEPHIRRYYAYLLQYGDDNEKGDFQVQARGASAMVERDVQNQTIANLTPVVANPIYGKDPKKWMDEFLKSQRLDPDKFNYDDDEWKQIVQNMSQPSDGKAEAAQLKAETERYRIDMDAKLREAQMQTTTANAEAEREIKRAHDAMLFQIETMKIEGASEDELKKIKGMLAKTVMTLKTQKELKATDVANPVAEPAGKAPDGEAFTR